MAKKTSTKTRTETTEAVVATETPVLTEEKKVKKTKGSKKETTVVEPTPEVLVETVPTPEVLVETVPTTSNEEDGKKKKKRSSKKDTVVEEETVATPEDVVEASTDLVEDEAVVVDDEVVLEESAEEKTTEKRKRRLVTKDKLLVEMEELQKELLPLLENHKKVQKLFKVVVSDTFRLLKIKTAQKKQKDATNSGFMRPVRPSVALEKFLGHLGENPSPLTRAHLTTLICKYIKEQDLQNPEDRRIIFPDAHLKELFQIGEEDPEPLTYYNIQKRIQPHVSRIEELAVSA